MKTNFFIVTNIIAAFLFAGCATEKNFDFKATVVPQTYITVPSPDDINKSTEIINKRLKDVVNIPQERIKLDVTENQISLTVSKIDISKIDLIRKMITGQANLEFWETYENSEIMGYLSAANNMLRDMQIAAERKDTNSKNLTYRNPLSGILSSRITAQGEPLPSCMIGLANEKDTSKINRYLKINQIKALFPHDLKFYWSQKPYKYDPSKSLYELHAIKVTRPDGQAPISGSVITSAKTIEGSTNSDVKIDLTMTTEGAKLWARITRENVKRCIAIVLNGYVRSYPKVMDEISGGETEITGDFTIEEARDLVNMLNSGELPFELKIIEEQIINN